ncbi:MAG TPA: TonB-dependent receptor [Candidatus Acidoferrales bacterium]
MNWKRFLGVMFALLAVLSLGSTRVAAQTTISQGSIQGLVTDPTGAVVPNAKISITNKETSTTSVVTSNASGVYNSGGLLPGDYVVRIEAGGFKTEVIVVTVSIAQTATGNIKLELGQGSTVVEVQSSAITVNTEQATVQGVLTGEQIDKLPVNGRNFLDLAQLEPGVQLQDGQGFDPTKAGYSSVSVNGVYGRTPRIEVDGLDVSDETVGTTTQNIAMSSIEEFSISRSLLDLSTELTASGAVNVVTRSGSNAFHGMGFYNFRDERAGFAALPGDQALPFQRNQFGGRFGGAIIKDKLFFFLDSERIKQDSLDAVTIGDPFQALTGGFTSPFRSTQMVGRLDWQATPNIRVFYKFTYDWNYSNSNAFAGGYSIYSNKDNTPSHAAGVDWNAGTLSNSFRVGYLKFHNIIGGGTGTTVTPENPVPGAEVVFGDQGSFASGPNFLAAQQTYQSDKQVKYDGAKVWGTHVIRFGAAVNRIEGGGFAAFYGLGPQIVSYVNYPGTGNQTTPFLSCTNANFVGCDPNPGDYPITGATLSNGQGFFTEKPGFNLPAGGQNDTRVEGYIGDSWKIKPNFTLVYGLKYGRDTGRNDADLAPIPCSATTLITCSGNLLDQFGNTLGLGDRVRQPNKNLGPQLGFAWSPFHDTKTVIRGGAGIYYENSIFNNTLFDRPGKLAQGLFFGTGNLQCTPGAAVGSSSVPFPVAGGGFNNVTSIDGLDLATQVCFQPLSVAGQAVADLQTAYGAATTAAGPAANGGFVGNTLTLGPAFGYAAYEPHYQPTRAYQMNIGFQREIVRGGVLSVDYVRNLSLHFPLTIDANHVGDSRFLNTNAALNAIGNTTAGFGCAGTDAAAINCAIAAGATIGNFASNGLDSGKSFLFGFGAPAFGLTPDTGAAFGGINPNVGIGYFQYPAGRSVYNGLQSEYKQDVRNPFRGVTGMNLQIAYTLSSYQGNGGLDQNFSAVAFDFRNPTKFFGPAGLDRTNQIRFGTTFEVAHHGPRLSFIGGFASPFQSDLATTSSGSFAPGEIFKTDLTGDGTYGDLINSAETGIGKPGTFNHGVSKGGLNGVLGTFNTNFAGNVTPAGQALINAGLFTNAQLVALGAVVSPIPLAPSNNAGNTWYRDVDAVMSWPFRIKEKLTIEPSVGFYNVFNFVNYNSLAGLTGAPGSINGTVSGDNVGHDSVRVGTGSGVFSSGAPRQTEFGLKLEF